MSFANGMKFIHSATEGKTETGMNPISTEIMNAKCYASGGALPLIMPITSFKKPLGRRVVYSIHRRIIIG
jgi:hypothetical protein